MWTKSTTKEDHPLRGRGGAYEGAVARTRKASMYYYRQEQVCLLCSRLVYSFYSTLSVRYIQYSDD